MRRTGREILHNQCEAYSINEAKRCVSLGEHTSEDGHRCCWVHYFGSLNPEANGGVIWYQEIDPIHEQPPGEMPF